MLFYVLLSVRRYLPRAAPGSDSSGSKSSSSSVSVASQSKSDKSSETSESKKRGFFGSVKAAERLGSGQFSSGRQRFVGAVLSVGQSGQSSQSHRTSGDDKQSSASQSSSSSGGEKSQASGSKESSSPSSKQVSDPLDEFPMSYDENELPVFLN